MMIPVSALAGEAHRRATKAPISHMLRFMAWRSFPPSDCVPRRFPVPHSLPASDLFLGFSRGFVGAHGWFLFTSFARPSRRQSLLSGFRTDQRRQSPSEANRTETGRAK